MSPDGGRRIRGYRPSRYGQPDEDNDRAQAVRLANLEVYAERASAGQPIFEDLGDASAALLKSRASLTGL